MGEEGSGRPTDRSSVDLSIDRLIESGAPSPFPSSHPTQRFIIAESQHHSGSRRRTSDWLLFSLPDGITKEHCKWRFAGRKSPKFGENEDLDGRRRDSNGVCQFYTAACISRPMPNRRARFHSARSPLKGETWAKWHIHPNLSHKIQIEDETLEQSVRGRLRESMRVWKERGWGISRSGTHLKKC